MMRIGDFSRLSRVPVKTLRYYDELGLIKPAQVDELTGYRYYTQEQYLRLNRVLALRDLGFSLERIATLLDAGLSADQMRGMLTLRQNEIRQRLGEEQGRLARIEAWLRQLDKEDSVSEYEVIIKRVAPQKVAGIRRTVPAPAEQGPLWRQLMPYIERSGARVTGPCITLYYDQGVPENDWDLEAASPIDRDVPPSGGIRSYELPGVETMASVVHHGAWASVNEAYAALQSWVAANGYEVAGPPREVVLQMAPPTNDGNADQNDPNTVVEIQFPVTKAS